MSGAYDHLFTKAPSGGTWWDTANPDIKAWITGLAEQIVERGRNPSSWKACYETCVAEFGDDAPDSDTTFRKYLRLQIDEAGG